MLKADPNNPKEIGSAIPGTVLKVQVNEGDQVKKNQVLTVVEAMKMETEIVSPVDGTVDTIYVSEGQTVESGELMMKIK